MYKNNVLQTARCLVTNNIEPYHCNREAIRCSGNAIRWCNRGVEKVILNITGTPEGCIGWYAVSQQQQQPQQQQQQQQCLAWSCDMTESGHCISVLYGTKNVLPY